RVGRRRLGHARFGLDEEPGPRAAASARERQRERRHERRRYRATRNVVPLGHGRGDCVMLREPASRSERGGSCFGGTSMGRATLLAAASLLVLVACGGSAFEAGSADAGSAGHDATSGADAISTGDGTGGDGPATSDSFAPCLGTK